LGGEVSNVCQRVGSLFASSNTNYVNFYLCLRSRLLGKL
jgi:hypothetical protein